MLFLIALIKRFGTLNATQKTTALYKAPFLKKSRKTAGNWPFLTKKAFLTIFRQFFQIFSKTVAGRSASQTGQLSSPPPSWRCLASRFLITRPPDVSKRLVPVARPCSHRPLSASRPTRSARRCPVLEDHGNAQRRCIVLLPSSLPMSRPTSLCLFC